MSPFRLEISDHARERLHQRRITRGQIRRCLTTGIQAGLDVRGRLVKQLRMNNRLLEVIYLEIKEGYIIVTAYWKGIYP